MYNSELEGNIASAFRAFDTCNYEVRRVIAKYLAVLLTAYQDKSLHASQSKTKSIHAINEQYVDK
jgi:hypothetical protein